MLDFRSILLPQCVRVGLKVKDKEALLVAMADLAVESGKIPDAAMLLKAIKEREALSSTGIGEGVAIPHALSDSVPETMLAVASLAVPIEFDSVDGKPVEIAFLMAGPRGETAAHLKLLSKLARILHDPDFREAARTAPDADTLVRLLYDRD